MKFLEKTGRSMKRILKRSGARIARRSPEILLVVGAVTFIGTVVVACRQTLKSEEVLDKHERDMAQIDNCIEMAKEDPEFVYTEKDAKRNRFLTYCNTGLGFARVYAPAVFLGAVSITCFGCSYNIMRKRNLALTVAYGAIDTAFKKYRSRVREELGEETDEYFRYGYKKLDKAIVVGKDRDGNDIEVVKENIDTVPFEEDVKEGDGCLNNATFIFAPETSKYYFPDEIHNDAGINAALQRARNDFDAYGFLFLNDVLMMLGIDKVPYGQLVGWKKGIGDQYIDFRTKKIYRKASDNPNKNPLGLKYECIYQFDFNTCGIIWDKI